MLHRLLSVVGVAFLLIAAPLTAASAADISLKSPPPSAPVYSWTGFYVGGEIGGASSRGPISYTPNDPVAASLLGGLFPVPGQTAFSANTLDMRGATGGLEAGYNWQVGRAWLLGVETDFNGSSLHGTGSSTSFAENVPGAVFTQTISENQKVDWYGTLRGRLGWLPSDNLLLFATGGFAYGRITESGTLSATGPFVGTLADAAGGISFSCLANNLPCFAGSSSSLQAGWTLGGGIEWFLWRHWSLKAEYQYVNLGSNALRLTATGTFAGSPTPSSFNVNFREDFNVVRGGLNYHF